MSADIINLRPEPPAWTFADYLRKARRERGMKQGEIAAKLEVGVKAYGAWESGVNTPRNLPEVAEKLEAVTGYPREWFLGWMDKAPQPQGPGGIESGRRDSNPQHSAWNDQSALAEVIPFAA